jgi:DNA excision repair protein ERCC-3
MTVEMDFSYRKQDAAILLCRREDGGSGVIVLPCGSGKTIMGLGTMARRMMSLH